jgi:hypothetical protein
MSNFKEAGANDSIKQGPEGPGLPLAAGLPMIWSNLSDDCCPKCGEALRAFEHLNLYKCPCGFKISSYKLEHIKLDLENQEDERRQNPGAVSGWGYSGYYDDPPF